MAEQDRYESHLGVNTDKIPTPSMPTASGAEQDRFGGWFSGKGDKATETTRRNVPRVSGAEQDRYDAHFGGHELPSLRQLGERLPKVSGAEQDRYDRWFGGDKGPSSEWLKEHMPKTSGAEQDRYAGWWGGKADEATNKISENLPKTSGAEQDRFGGWFGGDKLPSAADVKNAIPQVSGAEQDRYGSRFGGKAPSAEDISRRLPRVSGAEQDRYGTHFNLHPSNPVNSATTTTLGLLQNALLPSFGLHAGLSTVAYAVARYTDRAEAKDWLWPTGQVANAWWTAVGARVAYDGLSVPAAWDSLGYTQKLLLTGVSAWGLRLLYRIASRSARRGKDDARYVEAKNKDPRFWAKAFFSMFLPEAAFQAVIALPFTLPFQAPLASARASLFTEFPDTFHSLAVFLFASGFALETLADSQLESHSRKSKQLNREGVWSIVRHPNYLGDALCHLSFPILLYSAGMLHPLAVLGPVFNYVVLRYLGGDAQTEAHQEERYAREDPAKLQQLREYRREKNSFWPSVSEVRNKWLWIVVGAGVVGAVVERGMLAFFRG
ncbi:duf1295 domain protein [Colletotrichum sojae]|uniref:Duf1295 domain protein n=1 Tax=Colletotrichum sojae TaxID=2175907 RepID=A0A8H6MLM0_9PEZI|nr:duf1295 domain protein [Colletotrichum sojae]